MELKTCSSCNEQKELSCFPKTKGWHRNKCKSCRAAYLREYYKTESGIVANQRLKSRRVWSPTVQRRAKLKMYYGMTEEVFNTFLAFQDGRCAICKTDKPGGRNNRLQVDHCHKTGRVRGLLCWGCNKALGMAGDDLTGILRFVRYLLPWDQSIPHLEGLERLGREWTNNTHEERK